MLNMWKDFNQNFEELGISTNTAERLRASGYSIKNASLYGVGQAVPCISDSFYGSKWYFGLTPVDAFFNQSAKIIPPIYNISCMIEMNEILSQKDHLRFNDRMVFRGQTREYFTKREFGNPVAETEQGERLILPGYWRKFSKNWIARFEAPFYRSIFERGLADELVYYGIPDWQTLADRNLEKYGIHTISDLEDFPDVDSREYWKRWRNFKLQGPYVRDLPLVEQHYGIETCGLDVTFDSSIAAFFATHQFIKNDDGTARFDEYRGKERVIYAFVFCDPPLVRTRELVEEVAAFDHIKPIRPLRQQCALPFFHETNINEAVCDLHCIFKLSEDFDLHGVPSQSDIFPTTNEDPFYRAALEVQKTLPIEHPLQKIVHYSE